MDIIIILISIIAGIMTGIITGLIPGIHVNTIAAIMVSIAAVLYGYGIDSTGIAVYIASVAVAHAFFDYIPSLFLGVPNDEVFALLPGHRMVKEGRGIEALHLSIQGSWNGIKIGVSILLIVLLISSTGIEFFKILDTYIKPYLFWILSSISIILIFSETKRLWALLIFLLSGFYGMVVFGSALVPSTTAAFNGLFPALAGIFGVSGLIFSLFEKIGDLPVQKEANKLPIDDKEIQKSSIRGTGAGIAVGLLPGLGAANAATLLLLVENWLDRKSEKNTSQYRYIVTTSAINTSDTLFGIAALYFIEKTRSGASVAMSQLFEGDFSLTALIAVIFGTSMSAYVSMKIMKQYSTFIARFVSKLHYKGLNLSVLVFLILFIYLTLGGWGIVIMIGGTLLGMLPQLVNVRRAQAMGFFLLPVILFYSSYQSEIVSLIHLKARVTYHESIEINKIALYLIISAGISVLIYAMVSIFPKILPKK
ncbi:tripartite tricarboxylate transporter permease [Exiguobacterium sp. s36]|uniref:tripartite tricarboxylate transporter permease n=1 Tax=Exiguobacterium sp. s36 TaxID=2751227 RepID=UPI001BECF17A|nr:tripartite tricarboxylate transporter permease [Exiguobacterium sp. s36]